uniref:Transmembrane serine protease 5 n=1 Tax=Astyanax mexicanus TaxID=7994 RepID=W5KRA8_ASTMX
VIRVLAALCALGLLGGVIVGVWFIGKTSFSITLIHSYDCQEKPLFYRISAENSLLEIQLEKLQTWLPVCYERWNSSLGTLVCRQLGYLRLTKHKGVNLTDIGPNYTDGFVQIASGPQSNLESLWQFSYRLPQVSSWVVYAGIVTRNTAKLAQYTGYAVEKIIYNKNYNHRSHDNDIALMKLRTPLNFSDTIRPACLPQYDHDLPGGTQCWISGWGYTQPDDVPLISTKKCNSSCMYNGEITSRMLCAGYTEGKVDACQGDSGGPLVCQDDNVWRLVGVVSWGTGCAEPNHPGVYTKVAEFLGWIYEMIEVGHSHVLSDVLYMTKQLCSQCESL